MKTVLLNILGFAVGYLVLWWFFPVTTYEENSVAAFFIATFVSFIATNIICPPNKKQRKIGVIALGIAMFLRNTYVLFLDIKLHGFHFALALAFLLLSYVSLVVVLCGFNFFKEKPKGWLR